MRLFFPTAILSASFAAITHERAPCGPDSLRKTFNSRFLIRNHGPGSRLPWEPP